MRGASDGLHLRAAPRIGARDVASRRASSTRGRLGPPRAMVSFASSLALAATSQRRVARAAQLTQGEAPSLTAANSL